MPISSNQKTVIVPASATTGSGLFVVTHQGIKIKVIHARMIPRIVRT